MNFRTVLSLFIACIAITSPFAAGESKATAPNILWIITDDQRPDSLACYNQAMRGKTESELGYVSSPNVDRLAREGVLFTRAYCNSPACAPSRGSMLTGRYPFRSGIYGFEQTHNAVSTFKPVVPEVMRANGYQTALFGKSGYYIFKWGPGLTWNDVGFWEFEVNAKNDLQKHGLSDWFRDKRRGKVNGKPVVLGNEERWFYPDGTMKSYLVGEDGGEDGGGKAKNGKGKAEPALEISNAEKQMRAAVEKELQLLYAPGDGLIIGGVSPQTPEKTLDGCTVAEFIRYLDNNGRSYETAYGLTNNGPSSENPVFLNLGFHFPHTPVLPPQPFRDAFKSRTYAVPEFSLDELKKLPKQLQVLHEKMRFDNLNDEQKQQALRDYYAFCAYGDSLVGDAVEKFKAFSKAQNREWLIVYVCGDHGWHLGEQGIEAKFGPYDTSNHNAVIVVSSVPKQFPPGTVREEFVEFVDFAPTFYTAAGLDVSQPEFAYLDGQPLQHIVGGTAKPRDYVLGEMNHVYGPRAYLRSSEFAFSMRTRPKNGKPGQGFAPGDQIKWALECPREAAELALFDLRADPHERWNVADDPKYAPMADWFRAKLGGIVLGDRRLEVDWSQENAFHLSDFAKGTDDKKLEIPASLIPGDFVINSVSPEFEDLLAAGDLSNFFTGSKDRKKWILNDGVVSRGKEKTGGFMTRKKYKNFELKFEWKISEGGNSGVIYRANQGKGLEYQVLDDERHIRGKTPNSSAAALYDLVGPPADKLYHPAGEWSPPNTCSANLIRFPVNLFFENDVSIWFQL